MKTAHSLRLAILAAVTALTGAMSVSADELPVLHADGPALRTMLDGKPGSPWFISPDMHPFDCLNTSASVVKFACDRDSLTFTLLPWENRDFVIITIDGDSAFTRVTRTPLDPYLTPSPKYLNHRKGDLLSNDEASFDLFALQHAIAEIHPDPFTVTSSTDLAQSFMKVLESLPDSISVVDLYSRLAPIVTSIGDGHTVLRFPYNDLFTVDLKRLPMFVNISTDGIITAYASLDGAIAPGSRIISINGHTADEMIEAMMPYASGELRHFKLQRINSDFVAWFEMLYPADSYEIVYIPENESVKHSVTFPAVTWETITQRVKKGDSSQQVAQKPPYSFEIDSINRVAVMSFRSFDNPNKMKVFADSMFTALRESGIDRLVIDVSDNGGGNSAVGDELLKYISPVPFRQMEKVYMRRSPFTVGLLEAQKGLSTNTISLLSEVNNFIEPLTAEQGHFDGKVWLVTSNYTFSSADSFSNAFKHFGMGTVVGEETGGVNVAFGDLIFYQLPVSGIPVTISYKRFWLAGSDEKDIHPVIPDVKVPRSKALETAIRLASKANTGK